jgi:acetyltransferase-like isoleucine patch superfamily enzyme
MNYSYGIENVKVWNYSHDVRVKYGKYCSFGDDIDVILVGHNVNLVTTYPFGTIHQDVFPFSNQFHPVINGDVVIGNDVWVGKGSTIMMGIKIGDGAIIAANSHVVKDVEPYSIVGGNPAKVLKKRFTDEQIQKLLEIKWWDWTEEKINKALPYLCNPDINSFLDLYS